MGYASMPLATKKWTSRSWNALNIFIHQTTGGINNLANKINKRKKTAETLFMTYATLHKNYLNLDIARHTSPSDV